MVIPFAILLRFISLHQYINGYPINELFSFRYVSLKAYINFAIGVYQLYHNIFNTFYLSLIKILLLLS
jgi:hypothetical protein